MFSVQQKREISEAVQKILRDTNHPELPKDEEINFTLHVNGAEEWSWANIRNNGEVTKPSVNPHNEMADPYDTEEQKAFRKTPEYKEYCQQMFGDDSNPT